MTRPCTLSARPSGAARFHAPIGGFATSTDAHYTRRMWHAAARDARAWIADYLHRMTRASLAAFAVIGRRRTRRGRGYLRRRWLPGCSARRRPAPTTGRGAGAAAAPPSPPPAGRTAPAPAARRRELRRRGRARGPGGRQRLHRTRRHRADGRRRSSSSCSATTGRATGSAIERSLGSGVIVDADGHIVTNHHVIADADSIRCSWPTAASPTPASSASDPDTDLAILDRTRARCP